MFSHYFGDLQLTNWLFQKVLAAICIFAFASAYKQFPALLGERGLLPVRDFLQAVTFAQAPSIFHWHYSDRFVKVVSAIGIALSALVLFGLTDHLPWGVTLATWLGVWALYLSIVNVGQRFYGFGWESMLVEATFFAAFLGPVQMLTPLAPIIILRWMMFRVEFGAGMIKIRHDQCWRDLTCLFYHHETQPLPNPLSWYFHRLPKAIHKSGVAFSHLAQLVMPFGLFLPQPFAAIGSGVMILHQLILIVSGNYSWLNWLTVCLGITAFDDSIIRAVLPFAPHAVPIAYPAYHAGLMNCLLAITFLLSIRPALNLFSKEQLMNYSWNPLHLVNAYGAFGSMSRQRFEVVIEGTQDEYVSADTEWKEYEFKAKPGSLNRTPPQIAPYHLRLDWLMWFIPFGVYQVQNSLITPGYDLWFLRFIQKLLQSDRNTLRLLRSDPFANLAPPKYIRARYYLYQYTSAAEKKDTGNVWKRRLLADYLPPINLDDLNATLNLRGRHAAVF